MHWHSMLIGQKLVDTMTSDVGYTNLRGAGHPGDAHTQLHHGATWAGRCRAYGVRSIGGRFPGRTRRAR